jgi:glycine oxidase
VASEGKRDVKCDVAVIGGGVVGLSCAWRLAQGGAKVALFERGTCGREASWAAAGMIAPLVEAARHPPEDKKTRAAMLDLCLQSRDLYSDFAVELQENIELSLGDIKGGRHDWRKPGILYAATRSDDVALNVLQQFDESELVHSWLGFPTVHLPRHGQVNNQKLVIALQNAALHSGVVVHSCQPARIRRIQKDCIEIETPSHPVIQCDKLLLCAGAWSGEIEGLPIECLPPVRPIAGQMLALRPREAKLKQLLTQIIYSSDVYLVPKLNGQLFVGATMADIGFDKTVKVEGMTRLLQAAAKLLPDIESWEIVAQWAGLRPATPDGLPILGRTPIENLFVATGHFRNGILLTPITAQLMADCILNGKEPPQEFSLARFHQ